VTRLSRDRVRPTRTLQGIEGTHVTYHPDYSPEDDDPLQGIRFVVSSPLGKFLSRYRGVSASYQMANVLSLDPSLRDLTERVLPLGIYYTAISAFVESRSHLDFGLVNHALCAAIRDMLKVRVKSARKSHANGCFAM
jgi:gamma-tubulin complex component 2